MIRSKGSCVGTPEDNLIYRRHTLIYQPHKWLAFAVFLLSLGSAPQARASEPWGQVLRKYASADGVRYAQLKADPEARGQLSRFLARVAKMREGAPLAAWLNAYNALVIASVLKHHPLRSVKDVAGFFKQQRHMVAGKKRTLDEIEHGVIRKRFPDARIHMALNCGARSCPALWPRPFSSRTLGATLDRLARAAVGNPKHVRVHDGVLHVSSIFIWFRQDFRRDAGSLLAWLKRYGGHQLARLGPNVRILEKRYDWRLNEAQPRE